MVVAGPAADFLMSALARTVIRENRLTEVLACVLAADAELAAALLDRLGLGGYTVERVEVQMPTGVESRSMDMLLTLTRNGKRSRDVWCEHKLERDFHDGQLDAYETALRARRALGEDIHLLVVLGRHPKDADAVQLARMHADIRTWNVIADVIDRVLATRAPDWKRAALNPAARADLRVLAELAIHLEDNAKVAVSRPLDTAELGALEHIEAAHRVAAELLKRVAEQLWPGVQEEPYTQDEETWLWLQPTIGWWNDMPDGGLWLWIVPSAWFPAGANPTPSFGVSVHMRADQLPRLQGDHQFADVVDAAGLWLGIKGGETTVAAAKPLNTVVELPNLSQQADELAVFARQAISRLLGCVPEGANARALSAGEPSDVFDPSSLTLGA
jgi:hypothetical protein